MRIDYVVEHFPKGIGKSPVSVFAELLQSRLYKEAKAILQGSMMFLESCAGRLNRFATSHFCESFRDVLQIFFLLKSSSIMFPTHPTQWIIVSLYSSQTY